MALSSPALPLTTPSSSGSLNPASSLPHLMSKIPPALSSHPTNTQCPLLTIYFPSTCGSLFFYQPTTYPKVMPITSKIKESQGTQVDYDGNHEYWCTTLSTCNTHYSPRSIFLLHVVLFFFTSLQH